MTLDGYTIFFLGLLLGLIFVVIIRNSRAEGATQKNDITIKTGFPASAQVSRVVLKKNGEIVIVKKNGSQKRYKKGQTPTESWLRNLLAKRNKGAAPRTGTPKPSTPKPGTQKNDISITKGLPADVSRVVLKKNGEIVIVKKNGSQKRYKKGQKPTESWLIKLLAKRGKPGSTPRPGTPKPGTPKPGSQKNDITITKGLPADISRVVLKKNGEIVIVKKNGSQKRYKKGQKPTESWLIKLLAKRGKPTSKPGTPKPSGSSAASQAAIKKLEEQIKKLQSSLTSMKQGIKAADDSAQITQLKTFLEGKLADLKKSIGSGASLGTNASASSNTSSVSGTGYVDGGDKWILR